MSRIPTRLREGAGLYSACLEASSNHLQLMQEAADRIEEMEEAFEYIEQHAWSLPCRELATKMLRRDDES